MSIISQGYRHEESSIRKASVFCLVEIHGIVGEDLRPFLSVLTSSQVKMNIIIMIIIIMMMMMMMMMIGFNRTLILIAICRLVLLLHCITDLSLVAFISICSPIAFMLFSPFAFRPNYLICISKDITVLQRGTPHPLILLPQSNETIFHSLIPLLFS